MTRNPDDPDANLFYVVKYGIRSYRDAGMGWRAIGR